MKKKKIALIGSTGSIGASTLDVMRQYPEMFEVTALAAGKSAAQLVVDAKEFQPKVVAIADESAGDFLYKELAEYNIEILAGEDAAVKAVLASESDICLSAIVGTSGLQPTITAIECGMDIALANKESLVAAGEIITKMAKEKGVKILPVDSEHSALLQCMHSGRTEEISKLIITASGGAFRDTPLEKLTKVTAEDALAHPTWSMGRKITVDSATLANKALEVIEAHWLFDVAYEDIEVLVHRQSLIHGMVEFFDGTVIAQIAEPDMRLPIAHALAYPQRLKCGVQAPSFSKLRELTFEEPDNKKFPMLPLGFEAGIAGGLAPAVYSAANEEAVELFLAGNLAYPTIFKAVSSALKEINTQMPVTLDNILVAESEARKVVRTFH